MKNTDPKSLDGFREAKREAQTKTPEQVATTIQASGNNRKTDNYVVIGGCAGGKQDDNGAICEAQGQRSEERQTPRDIDNGKER